MQYKISHSFCDLGIYPFSLMVASLSERRFFGKDSIYGFYHRPRSPEIFAMLRDLVTIIPVDNLTKPFATCIGGLFLSYGEKIHAAKINCPNILLMDCDILMVHDPSYIWDEDFDLAVAPMTPCMTEISKDPAFIKNWNELFTKYGKKPISHFETGVMFFKDNILKEIKDEYLEIMDTNIPRVLDFYDKEQTAFALVMSDKKIKYLTYSEFGDFRYRTKPFYANIRDWEKESTPTIWHIGYRGLEVKQF